ncbi:MAG: hypothetical protein ACK42C_03895 [Aquificaceae bacterium]
MEDLKREGKIEPDIHRVVDTIKDICPKKILNSSKEKKGRVYYRFERDWWDAYPYFVSKPKLFRKRAIDRSGRVIEELACKMCGLSVFVDLEELLKTIQEKFNNANPTILECANLENYGEVYATPSRDNPAHRTFFPCEGYEPSKVWNFADGSP